MTEQDISISKRCETCKEDVVLSMFSKNRSTKDGFSKACKPCRKAYDSAYYEKVKTRVRDLQRRYYQENKDACLKRARKWEAENPERKKELRAAYREQNREKIKEFSKVDWTKHNEARRAAKKAYRRSNPERGAEHVRARQTRKQQAMPDWADRDAIRAIYRQCAWASKITGIKHHVDHFYPLKNSLVCGLHCEYNLRIIPAVVNLSKGNRIPD